MRPLAKKLFPGLIESGQEGVVNIIFLLGILVVVGAGAYFLLNSAPVVPPPIPPANLSANNEPVEATYLDEQLGFEFKYPSKETSIQKDSEDEYSKRGQSKYRQNFTGYVGYEPPKVKEAFMVLAKDKSFDLAPFSLWVFENPNKLNAEVWYDRYWYYPFMWGVFIREHKYMPSVLRQATISGELTEFRLLDYQEGKPEYFYFPHKENMILIRVLTEKNNGEAILKTFKLVN